MFSVYADGDAHEAQGVRQKRTEDKMDLDAGNGKPGPKRAALGELKINEEDTVGAVAKKENSRPVTRSVRRASMKQSPEEAPSSAGLSKTAAPESVVSTTAKTTVPSLGAPTIHGLVDIDASVAGNPAHSPDYIDDIYSYLRQLELNFRPKHNYMRKQRDINHSMRAILVDWLVEVTEEYRLDAQTLYTAVGYIDRFLSEMSVQRGKLQLVGVTAMLLASKYEEIYPPAVDEFVYITDSTYTRDQILKMEQLVLKVLKFDMGGVTSLTFCNRFIKAAGEEGNEQIKNLSCYILELSLQDGENYLQYKPSVMALSALCVGLHTLGIPHWSEALQHYSQLKCSDIIECTRLLHETFRNAAEHPQQAVREKFSLPKFGRVALQQALPYPPPF